MKYLLDALRSPASIAEILFLALVFFILLNFIRGTRGAIILKGIIFVFVIAFVGVMSLATALGLEHIVQLLKWFLSISFVAVIVVFAPEIRGGLSRLAQSGWFIRFVQTRSDRSIRDIVDASFNLSKKRIGALIAMLRETTLEDIADRSVRLDADISSHLIETIFCPGSPLHDGGIIVRHGKIAAASCIFPLSDAPDLPMAYGTRHRAAIGITEETDAVAVVVSEETGQISVCVRGRLTIAQDREALHQILSALFSGEDRAEGLGKILKATRRKLLDTLKTQRTPVQEEKHPTEGKH